jgi:hypothetical protein
MKTFFSILISLIFTVSTWSQCYVVGNAMGSSVLCNVNCNGTINYVYQNTNMSSPGAPYIVILSNQTTGQVISTTTYIQEIQTIPFTGLYAGAYQIVVQAQSCSFVSYAIVSQPTAINAYVNTVDPSPGSSNGSASIIVSGGVSPFSFSLNGGAVQGSNLFTGLDAGTYIANVQDAIG